MKSTQAEQWRPIPGYEGYYEVSDTGNIRSFDRLIAAKGRKPYIKPGRLLKASPSKSGHMRVAVTKDGEMKFEYVHRIVLSAFVGPCPLGFEACHKNDIPSDNRIENLRWADRSENMYDRTRNGIDNNGTKYATHCQRGHRFDRENTIIYKDGHRACRQCKNAADRKRRKATRVAKPPRTHCKRGHLLEPTNLRKGQLPRRDCLACHRANSYARHHGLQHEIQTLSDSYYSQIKRSR